MSLKSFKPYTKSTRGTILVDKSSKILFHDSEFSGASFGNISFK